VKADVIAAGCIWVQTREAVVDGNIVTAGRRPDYDVWMRAFVNMLNERGINKAKTAESSPFLQAGFPRETEAKDYVAKH